MCDILPLVSCIPAVWVVSSVIPSLGLSTLMSRSSIPSRVLLLAATSGLTGQSFSDSLWIMAYRRALVSDRPLPRRNTWNISDLLSYRRSNTAATGNTRISALDIVSSAFAETTLCCPRSGTWAERSSVQTSAGSFRPLNRRPPYLLAGAVVHSGPPGAIYHRRFPSRLRRPPLAIFETGGIRSPPRNLKRAVDRAAAW